jgi:hypothetical protein
MRSRRRQKKAPARKPRRRQKRARPQGKPVILKRNAANAIAIRKT